MNELRKCSTCAFWREGKPTFTSLPVGTDSSEGAKGHEVGSCEIYPPQVFVVGTFDQIISIHPTTHASRRCGEWRNADWFHEPSDDFPPRPGGPPDHEPGGVRHLFPIRPVPSAA